MWNKMLNQMIREWPYVMGFMGLIVIFYVAASGPKSVTISAKQWECTASDTFGIEARCTQYSRVKSFQERQ